MDMVKKDVEKFSKKIYSPLNIFIICDYILSTLKTPYKSSFECLINQILTKKIDLKLYGYHGMSSQNSKRRKIVTSLNLFGNDMYLIPLEIFLIHKSQGVHKLLKNMTSYQSIFLNNEISLKGSIHLSQFSYNDAMEKYFNPSLIVITLYCILINILVFGSKANINIIDELRLMNKNILEYIEDDKKISCFYDKNRINKTKEYLKGLYSVINESYNIIDLLKNIEQLWKKCAEDY